MMPLTIRRIQGRDIGPLREMSVDFFDELKLDYPVMDESEIDKHMLMVLSQAGSPDCIHLIAYDGKKPVGFFLGYVGDKPYSKPSRVGVAEELYVVPNKRGGPVGLKLMQQAGKIAIDLGAEAMECIGSPNHTMERWEKFGFKAHTIYGHMENDSFMKLVGRFVGEKHENL
jgi:GNAT superfamily N-acetyltransferase